MNDRSVRVPAISKPVTTEQNFLLAKHYNFVMIRRLGPELDRPQQGGAGCGHSFLSDLG
jgi:hypothetical protein